MIRLFLLSLRFYLNIIRAMPGSKKMINIVILVKTELFTLSEQDPIKWVSM